LSQESDVTLEIVDEGKEHIKREKRRRQRLMESQTRRREFASRFGEPDDRGEQRQRLPGTDAMILKIFSPKNLAGVRSIT
jgi:hypothetical protein